MVNQMDGGRRALIGVCGGSGSGKTTFCQELCVAIGSQLGNDLVLVLRQDDYYRDLSHLEPEERDRVNFDHPDAVEFALLEEDLDRLLVGMPIQIPRYDFATHTRQGYSGPQVPKPVIIVDGILLFARKSLLDRFSLRLFIDTPKTVRFERRLARDVAQRGRTPEGVRRQFDSTVTPMHDRFVEPHKVAAHHVVSGLTPFAEPVAQVLREIADLLS